MPEVIINWGAVILCGIAAMVLGSIWYSPATPIGKAWIKEKGFTKDDMTKAVKEGMTWRYVLALVGSLLTAYIMSHFADYMLVNMVGEGLSLGFWLWLGIAMPIILGTKLWENVSWKLFVINAGYQLALLLIMGAIIASMND
jgi:hypothetical protein